MKKILIATHNMGKFSEINEVVRDLSYEFVSLSELGINEDIEETGLTFEENAKLKARYYAKLSGLPALGDDSGLEVEALGGEPGIYSSRYAGEQATDQQKVAFLLEKMKDVPDDKRQGGFRTVIAFAMPSGQVQTYEGRISGIILREPKGPILMGLPYCSILYLPEYGKSVAQLKIENGIVSSQRIQALNKFIADLSF